MYLRKFIAERGKVPLIRSDNGSNFIGAPAELIQEMDHSRIWNLEEHGGDWMNWKRNHPFASNIGGGGEGGRGGGVWVR